jgi:thiol-disulfide isomerase/thioredoxin
MKSKLSLIVCLLVAGCSAGLTIDAFDIYKTEAFMAYAFNDGLTKPAPIPSPTTPDNKTCTCGGTKQVKTGDGLHMTECPCGPSCSCKANNSEQKKNKRVLYFGQKGCSPCRQVQKNTFPVLKTTKPAWTIGDADTNLIQVLDFDKNNDLAQKFNIDSVPTFILLNGNKEVKRVTGFMTPKQFTDFFFTE